MKILFPNHPQKARLPDPDYESEFDAALGAGFGASFIAWKIYAEAM